MNKLLINVTIILRECGYWRCKGLKWPVDDKTKKNIIFNVVATTILVVAIAIMINLNSDGEETNASQSEYIKQIVGEDASYLTENMDAQTTLEEEKATEDEALGEQGTGADTSDETSSIQVSNSPSTQTETTKIPSTQVTTGATMTYTPITISPVRTPAPTSAPVIVSTPAPTSAPVIVSTPTPTKKPSSSSEYILPYSNSKFYTKAEISGLSAKQLRLARNEIYARHGAIFTAADLDAHFRSCSWYKPTRAVSAIDEDAEFNVYEYTNMEVIRGLE